MPKLSISLEGRWMNLRNLVQSLIDDGWVITRIEPNAEFTLTEVEMER